MIEKEGKKKERVISLKYFSKYGSDVRGGRGEGNPREIYLRTRADTDNVSDAARPALAWIENHPIYLARPVSFPPPCPVPYACHWSARA